MIGGSITMPRVLSPDWSITSKTIKSQDSVPVELREQIECMVNVPSFCTAFLNVGPSWCPLSASFSPQLERESISGKDLAFTYHLAN